MTSMTDGLLGQLQGEPMERIARQLGLAPAQAQGAVAAAVPLLMGTLGRNAQQPAQAQSLLGALQRDHAGADLGGVLGSALGGGGAGPKILGHLFGQRQTVATDQLGTATGLAPDKAQMLLRVLAPLVMAYVAKQLVDQRAEKRRAAATATAPVATPRDLQEALGQEEQRITQRGGPGGGLLGSVLDRNGDGRVTYADLVGPLPSKNRGASSEPRTR